jgi:Methyltransferase domain
MNRRGGGGGGGVNGAAAAAAAPASFGTPSRNDGATSITTPPRANTTTGGASSSTTFLYIVLVGIFLVWQAMRQMPGGINSTGGSLESFLLDPSFMPASLGGGGRGGVGTGAAAAAWNTANPLDIPQGEAPSLPTNSSSTTTFSGGAADAKKSKPMLDWQSLSPSVWKHMISDYGIHSMIDVGCGQIGATSAWFQTHGVKTLCIDAMPPSLLDENNNSKLLTTTSSSSTTGDAADSSLRIVQHDYTRGPWWPKNTYDAAWAVEFLEHVPLQHQFNYISTFRKAALIFVTSSQTGGGVTGAPGSKPKASQFISRTCRSS